MAELNVASGHTSQDPTIFDDVRSSRWRTTCERGLFCSQGCGVELNDADVSRNFFAYSDLNDVTGQKLSCWQCRNLQKVLT